MQAEQHTQRLAHLRHAAAGKVRPAIVTVKKRVAGKDIVSRAVTHAAACVAGRVQHLKGDACQFEDLAIADFICRLWARRDVNSITAGAELLLLLQPRVLRVDIDGQMRKSAQSPRVIMMAMGQ